MIIVYTGNGKGKSSASVGQAIRAKGQDMRVAFAQFIKRPGKAGEQRLLAELLREDFFAGGLGFFINEESRAEHRQAALAVLAWAQKALDVCGMLVLDESLYALGSGLILEDELKNIIGMARNNNAHLVLSGRGLPDWLRDEADIVTELCEVKHYFASRQGEAAGEATRGIEF